MTDARDGQAPDDLGRIGPYTILRTLGEGGMGVVYEAEQHEPVKRHVAIKLIRGGADFADIAARFEAERQALAVMEHPHIAKVLDGGTTPGGSPYFVMEYVEGLPITEYCDANQLAIPARLRLFAEVCDAIQHAHRKGIIHRDLKPNNILITEQAGAAHPKVIDFGIAKAAGIKLTEKTLATQFGAVMGTPAYMSPEQAGGSGLDVDTRTDVYALGVILYELLVGRVPLDPEELGFPRFLAKLVMEDTLAPTPSTRLMTDPGTADTVSGRRRSTTAELKKRLAGDLDWIAMKAIETDRERRYGSVRELADDVERYLADEPIEARPLSASYRFAKFVRRNRAAVIAAAAALLILVGGAVASTIGFVRASRAERTAVAEGERARLEAETANQVSEFLTGLFRAANPGNMGRSDVTALEVLDQGLETIEEDLADQPEVQARLYRAMSGTYLGLGLSNRALELMRRALELQEEALGPDHPEVATTLLDLVISVPRYADDPDRRLETDILEMAERARSIREANFDADPGAWGNATTIVADHYESRGRFDEAVALIREAIPRVTGALGENDPAVLAMRKRLALTYANADREAEAIPLMEDLLATVERLDPPDSSMLAGVVNDLAWVHGRDGAPEKATPYLERALALERAALGSGSPTDLEPIFWNLSNNYLGVGRADDAVALLKELVEIFGEVYGPEHLETVGYHTLLTVALLEAGRPAEALEPTAVAARVLGEAYDEGVSEQTLGRFLEALGFHGMALWESGRGEPVPAMLALAGDRPVVRQGALRTFAWMLEGRAPPEDIYPVTAAALDAAEAIGTGDPAERIGRLRDAFIDHTVSLLRLKKVDEIRALGPRWERAMAAIEPGDNFTTLQVLRDMASVTYRGEPARDEPPIPELQPDALPYLQRALAMRERIDGDGIHLIEHLVPLRTTLLLLGRDAEARAAQDRVRALIEARIAELDAMRAAGEIVEAARYNGNCWWAALAEIPEVALSACDAAVEGAVGDEIPRFHDSRAVARAVMGDIEGAIEDFEVYLSFRDPQQREADRRSGWVDELRSGRNPLTGFTLGALGF